MIKRRRVRSGHRGLVSCQGRRKLHLFAFNALFGFFVCVTVGLFKLQQRSVLRLNTNTAPSQDAAAAAALHFRDSIDCSKHATDIPQNPTCQTFWYDTYTERKQPLPQSCIDDAIAVRKALCSDAPAPVPMMSSSWNNKKETDFAIVFTTSVVHELAAAVAPVASLMRSQWGLGFAIELMSENEQAIKECQKHSKHLKLDCFLMQNIEDLPESTFLKSSGYVYKVMAIAQSRHRHVLYLDTDALPVLSPATLFASVEYQRTGAIFWPDLWGVACRSIKWGPMTAQCGQAGWPEHILWYVLGLPWRKTEKVFNQEMDTGQLLVDTVLHRKALDLALRLTADKTIQRWVFGDKESFRFAWLALNHSFTFVPHDPGVAGHIEEEHQFFRDSLIMWAPDSLNTPIASRRTGSLTPAFVHQAILPEHQSVQDLVMHTIPPTAGVDPSLSTSPQCYQLCKLNQSDISPLPPSVAQQLSKLIDLRYRFQNFK